MIKYFAHAWADTGLTPLEKLVWLRICDSGMSQTCSMHVSEWVQWTGAEDFRDVIDALQSLKRSGRVESYGVRDGDVIFARSRFAEAESETWGQGDKSNVYRKQPIPPALRQAVFERDGHKCTYCGSPEALCADHVYPEVLGGETTEENLTTACKPCNLSKGAKTLAQWRGADA